MHELTIYVTLIDTEVFRYELKAMRWISRAYNPLDTVLDFLVGDASSLGLFHHSLSKDFGVVQAKIRSIECGPSALVHDDAGASGRSPHQCIRDVPSDE